MDDADDIRTSNVESMTGPLLNKSERSTLTTSRLKTINKHLKKTEPIELFEGRCPLDGTWWTQRVFFSWASPLVNYVNKTDVLRTKHIGKPLASDSSEAQYRKLLDAWDSQRGKKSLWRAVMVAWSGEFVFWAFWNAVSIIITLA